MKLKINDRVESTIRPDFKGGRIAKVMENIYGEIYGYDVEWQDINGGYFTNFEDARIVRALPTAPTIDGGLGRVFV